MAPSNETEAEMLERRKVEALEAIAKALATLAACTIESPISGKILAIRQR